MILQKGQYGEIWQFSMIVIYHFLNVPYSPFQKNEKWNLNIIGYLVIGAGF